LSYRYENRLAADVMRLIQDPVLRNRIAARGESDSRSWTWENSVKIMERTAAAFLKGNGAGKAQFNRPFAENG
jgi:hypothetical protein